MSENPYTRTDKLDIKTGNLVIIFFVVVIGLIVYLVKH